MTIEEGCLRFRFLVSNISSVQGLISKDATGNGNHLSIYLTTGDLVVRVQDSFGAEEFLIVAVAQDTEHEVEFQFGPDGYKLFLDGIEEAAGNLVAFQFDQNAEPLNIAALGWHTQPGEGGSVYPLLSGWVSDVEIKI